MMTVELAEVVDRYIGETENNVVWAVDGETMLRIGVEDAAAEGLGPPDCAVARSTCAVLCSLGSPCFHDCLDLDWDSHRERGDANRRPGMPTGLPKDISEQV